MVVVSVGEENIVHLEILGIHLRLRISPQKRIDNQPVSVMVNFETAVPVVADLHIENPFLWYLMAGEKHDQGEGVRRERRCHPGKT
jgi:hypothetical protein